jgi:hypothetical protein
MSRPPFGTRANDSIARSKEGSHLRAFDAVTLRPIGVLLPFSTDEMIE